MAEKRARTERKIGKSVWTFVNSNFGLWLIGTVALGVVVWGAQELRAHYRSQRAAHAFNSCVRGELHLRLEEALRAAYTDVPGAAEPNTALRVLNTSFRNPDFKEYPFDGLVQIYGGLIPNSKAGQNLMQATSGRLAALKAASSVRIDSDRHELTRQALSALQRDLRVAVGAVVDDCKTAPERTDVVRLPGKCEQ